jgi:acetolactate synthase-1/2/3 large subunit
MRTVAEWFLQSVAANGCEAIFLNPGTDTPPLQEAWAKLHAAGAPMPKLVLCPHEVVAVTAAQGYYLASGRPQVAFVHVDVGTANAAGGLNDARASQIPMLLCAGTSSSVVDSRVPGSRTKFINWLQDVPDQAALVRNYVKWSHVLNHPAAIGAMIDRAFQIARSDPSGPVYLAMSRELMMQEVSQVMSLGPGRTRPALLPGLPDATADRLAGTLLDAEFPLLLTGYGGRSSAHRDAIVQLAEKLGLAIAEYRGRFNAPLTHELHLGFNPERWVGESDLILVLDFDVPFVPADRPLRPGARLIHLGPDPIQSGLIVWGFPADEVLPCGVLAGLGQLQAASERALAKGDRRKQVAARRKRISARHEAMLAAVDSAGRPSAERPNTITPFAVGRALTKLCPTAHVFEEAVTSGNPFAYGFRPTGEGAYFRNGGSFLGWGLGASLGAKMAAPDRLIVAVVGDGSFIFGAPLAALWTARQQDAPLLIIVVNNAAYNSVRLAVREAYPTGVQATSGYVGVDLVDPPAFETVAASAGAWGQRVERHEDLEPAIREAIEVVRGGRTALVNVLIEATEQPL